MTLTLDVRRMFRSTTVSKAPASAGTLHFKEGENLKARHILGLDSTSLNASGRDDSVSSTATSKQRGVTFSDATTAVVSTGSTADETDEGYASGLKRKGSSLLLKTNRKTNLQSNSLRPQVSDSSLRSFYDKSRIPLSVSQQTSDSSSRDFALRRGAPSIISNSSQEKEHIKQLRLLSKNHKSPGDRRKQLANESAPSRASSLKSTASSIFEHNSNAEGSQVSKPSTARISITRMPVPEGLILPSPISHSVEQEHPYAMVKTTVDPTQARINVRRPKVGTRNWFDNIDSDSSEGEDNCLEPRLETDFAVGMGDAYENGHTRHVPSRTSSTALESPRAKHTKKQDQRLSSQQDAKELLKMAEKYELVDSHRRRKHNPFEAADLTHQSLLWLSSSEDSDTESEQQHLRTPKTKIRDSLVNGSWDESETVYGKAVVGAKSPEVVVKDIRTHGINANIPKRKGSKLKLQTYLEDESTTTLTHHDLLTSFPETPVDDVSRAPSLRDSMLSESESMTSTKVMTVTRQEETLIAAMRKKKIALKKARAVNDRNDALRVLEQNAGSVVDPPRSMLQKLQPQASKRQSVATSKRLSAVRNASRQDSVTTIQTDSMAGQSVRSSIATYLSEGSEDLQLPYSSIYGLPMGSSVIRPSLSPNRRREPRDTFLSEMTVDSTITASSGGERPGSTRDSHVVLLDAIDRQMLVREDIPSQLFLEPPYVGWSIQAAH